MTEALIKKFRFKVGQTYWQYTHSRAAIAKAEERTL